jgi:anthranilate phosphoribosyltransferase
MDQTPSEPPRTPPDLTPFLRRVTEGRNLTVAEAEEVFEAFMEGTASPVQMAGVLAAIRTKGVVSDEVAGGVRALRKAMIPVPYASPDRLVDTAGTGGGTVTTFNISTAAGLVAAGAGVAMAKHGNRSFTSRSGSADVLEALGVRIDLAPERMGEILSEVGIVFMFAPLLHPAMRHVAPVRRGLGIPTIMNILGPLTNPAGARRQVVGVADPGLLELIAGALATLGHERALVVHGHPGMDEISPSGPTRVLEVRAGEVLEREITPAGLGLEEHALDGLAGGDPDDNARLIRGILEGREGGAARAAVLLNAAAAIYVAGRAETLEQGVAQAADSIDSGAALRTLDALVEASNG